MKRLRQLYDRAPDAALNVSVALVVIVAVAAAIQQIFALIDNVARLMQ